jgi:hypothetical protein
MSKEIVYEDDKIIVYAEYEPASHIYDNDEINLNIFRIHLVKGK